jgi:hypothetical protein
MRARRVHRIKVTRLINSFVMAFLIVAVNAIATYVSHRTESNTAHSVSIIATAVISFVGLLALTQPQKGIWDITEAHMRTAIAGTIVVEYLVLVATVAFLKGGAEALPPITQTLISNFTSIVGIVIAFYFGASAYIEARAKHVRPDEIGVPRGSGQSIVQQPSQTDAHDTSQNPHTSG